MYYTLIVITVLLTSFGQLILKWRLNSFVHYPEDWLAKLIFIFSLLLDRFVILSFALAFLASLTWIAALTKFELSVAYPYMSLSFVLVLLFGYLWLGESISAHKISGTILIVIGVALLQRT